MKLYRNYRGWPLGRWNGKPIVGFSVHFKVNIQYYTLLPYHPPYSGSIQWLWFWFSFTPEYDFSWKEPVENSLTRCRTEMAAFARRAKEENAKFDWSDDKYRGLQAADEYSKHTDADY